MNQISVVIVQEFVTLPMYEHHSTETLLTSLYTTSIGRQQVSCLCLLDIPAAFDTMGIRLSLQNAYPLYLESLKLPYFEFTNTSTSCFRVRATAVERNRSLGLHKRTR